LIHDGLYKPWSVKVLKEFSDDYEEEIEEKTKENVSHVRNDIFEEDIKITGRFNTLAPLFIH
jgi:hypothetical protein